MFVGLSKVVGFIVVSFFDFVREGGNLDFYVIGFCY